jgi:hypothetical protein
MHRMLEMLKFRSYVLHEPKPLLKRLEQLNHGAFNEESAAHSTLWPDGA